MTSHERLEKEVAELTEEVRLLKERARLREEKLKFLANEENNSLVIDTRLYTHVITCTTDAYDALKQVGSIERPTEFVNAHMKFCELHLVTPYDRVTLRTELKLRGISVSNGPYPAKRSPRTVKDGAPTHHTVWIEL